MANKLPKSRGRRKYLGWGFVLAIGVAILTLGVSTLLRSADTANWPTTNGVVINSTYEKQVAGSNNHYPDGYIYWPRVTYEYEVSGRTYSSSRISTADWSMSYGAVQQVLSQYTIGTKIKAHYDPNDPNEAVLQTSVGTNTYIPTILGLGFTIIGVVGIVWVHRANRR